MSVLSASLSGIAIGLSVLVIFYTIANLIRTRKERSNGRYRKAAEAHRVGAGGGAVAGSYAGGGSSGGAGASMNPYGDYRRKLAVSTPPYTYTSVSTSVPKAPTTPKPQAGEFTGASFAAGVVTGARSFTVDKLGRLAGVTYKIVWTPGENVAKCYKHEYDAYGMTFTYPPSPRTVAVTEPHEITTCGHGFYGYYDGSDDYHQDGMISGVIEGYGETLIGTRGFRASKARIVALHIPEAVPKATANLIARNYPDIPRFDSFEAMVSAFPTDDGGKGLNPETDPEFWTRSI